MVEPEQYDFNMTCNLCGKKTKELFQDFRRFMAVCRECYNK